MNYSKKDVLNEIDLAFGGKPSDFFPEKGKQVVQYNFFLDLEHGYCDTASSRIHLYANDKDWAVVFEKSGYQNRARAVEIELYYIGNCIDYLVSQNGGRNYITNTKVISLISFEELGRIENRSGSDMEQFELIDSTVEKVEIRGAQISVDLNPLKYDELRIPLRVHDNPKRLIGFGDLVRFFQKQILK